jgi:hypothetical protein
MELINDGRFDYKKSYIFNHAVQDATVTFSMKNVEDDILKISKAKAEIVTAQDTGCETKYLLQYTWKPRDVKEPGTYKGWFEIKFNGDIYENGVTYPAGNLIVPIEESLLIHIN